MGWSEDSNEKTSRVNEENILNFIRERYPGDTHMTEIENHLKLIGMPCSRKYIRNHIGPLMKEGMIEESGRGWKLKPLGSTEGTRLLHDNKETELALMPISQQPMSGEQGTVWIEGRDQCGLSQIVLRYNNKEKSIDIKSGQDIPRSLWDVNLGSDELSIWGKPFIPKSQVFIRCFVTLKLGEKVPFALPG